jgi:hypothetical protein
MEEPGGEEVQLLLLLNLGTRRDEWSESRPGRTLLTGKGLVVGGRGAEPVWTQWLQENPLDTTLYWLLTLYYTDTTLYWLDSILHWHYTILAWQYTILTLHYTGSRQYTTLTELAGWQHSKVCLRNALWLVIHCALFGCVMTASLSPFTGCFFSTV